MTDKSNKKRDDLACLDCRHCWIDGATPGYSSWTPATPATWRCLEGHYAVDWYELTSAGIKSYLRLGATCKDYELEP